jgi:hypothetical protein
MSDSTPMAAPAAADASYGVIPGRECGSCSLCCKVYNIPEIGKASGKWCTHCTPGKGCKIHEKLPGQCAQFECLWRTETALPPLWKPDQARMVVTIHPLNRYIYVQVDPGVPSAWRRQPYYDHLREWAKKNLQKGMLVIVFVNDLATLIMPDQDLPLGPLKPTDRISVRQSPGPGGTTYDVTITADPVARPLLGAAG